MKRLIVNADDFGLTSGVNAAIAELYRHGTLTSATLMAKAAVTDEAVSLALAQPRLGVGCHVVLVDGESVLTPRKELVWLVDPISANGRFHPTLGGFFRQLYLDRGSIWRLSNPKLEKEIEEETSAQIMLLQSRGIQLTHIDTHKHTHMFPRVLRSVLRGARAAGIKTVRNPFEPEWSTQATPEAPLIRRIQVKLLRTMRSAFERMVAEEGFETTDGAIGVLATGTLDPKTLHSLLLAMPDGTWELVTHPGYNDTRLAQAGTRLLASREIERQTLMAAKLPEDVQLINFGHIAG